MLEVSSSGSPGARRVVKGGGTARCWRVIGLLLFFLIVSVIFASTLVELVNHSLAYSLHSHTILIPFVSAYLIFLKRSSFAFDPIGSPLVGVGVIIFGVAIMASTSLAANLSVNDGLAIEVTSYLFVLLGGALVFLGGGCLRLIAFPLFLLIFMIPLPDLFVENLEGFLVFGSSVVSYWLFQLSGIPVFREGDSVEIPGIVLEVARECSGIRSTWVLVITSMIAAYLFLDTSVNRLVLVAVVLPLGVLRNATRILVIGWLCVHYGPEMIHSWIHRNGGPLFFALALLPLFTLGILLRRNEVGRQSSR